MIVSPPVFWPARRFVICGAATVAFLVMTQSRLVYSLSINRLGRSCVSRMLCRHFAIAFSPSSTDERKKNRLLSSVPPTPTLGGLRGIAQRGQFGRTPAARHLSASSGDSPLDGDQLIARQKATSTELSRKAVDIMPQEEAEHLRHQRRVFDDMVEYFEQDIPSDLVPVYEHLAKEVISKIVDHQKQRNGESASEKENGTTDIKIRILDVACGTGVLFDFLLQEANRRGLSLQITGVDLSPGMVQKAQDRIESLASAIENGGHQLSVQECDIMKFQPKETQNEEYFDAIIVNACFGNFWDGTAVLERMCPWLKEGSGAVFVTHPLGAEFVEKLHQEDPSTVPHVLPASIDDWTTHYTRYLPLQAVEPLVQDIQFRRDTDTSKVPFYFTILKRVRHVALRQLICLRGSVDAGYGRGGKKLGFPTANLPSSLFQDALKDVSTGVYFGWAILEHETVEGENVCHKAVVNVGYSPTFQGEENKEKIVEAHIILGEPIGDFYNETMRLQLHGFLRPEMKFPSFPDLIAQIGADVQEAKEALDLEPYRTLKRDPFLVNNNEVWVGTGGGDVVASWEFQATEEAIHRLTGFN